MRSGMARARPLQREQGVGRKGQGGGKGLDKEFARCRASPLRKEEFHDIRRSRFGRRRR